MRNIRNERICMGKKTYLFYTYEKERISIKKTNSLPYLKCVLRLSCVIHGPIYGHFIGFNVTGFLSTKWWSKYPHCPPHPRQFQDINGIFFFRYFSARCFCFCFCFCFLIIRAFCHGLPSIWLFLQVEGKCRQDFLGARGVMGVQGDVGPRGAPGPKGIRGNRGPKGFSYITEPVPLVGQKGIKGNPGI